MNETERLREERTSQVLKSLKFTRAVAVRFIVAFLSYKLVSEHLPQVFPPNQQIENSLLLTGLTTLSYLGRELGKK